MNADNYVELTGDDLPYHLRPDAQGTRCSSCHRTTWSQFGEICNMLQPDGSRCMGFFGLKAEKHPADVLADRQMHIAGAWRRDGQWFIRVESDLDATDHDTYKTRMGATFEEALANCVEWTDFLVKHRSPQ